MKCTFDSVDRTARFSAFYRSGMPTKVVIRLQALYSHSCGCERVYGELSSSFEVTIGVRQTCPISPFLMDFVKVIENAFGSLPDVEFDLANGNELRYLDYALTFVLV